MQRWPSQNDQNAVFLRRLFRARKIIKDLFSGVKTLEYLYAYFGICVLEEERRRNTKEKKK